MKPDPLWRKTLRQMIRVVYAIVSSKGGNAEEITAEEIVLGLSFSMGGRNVYLPSGDLFRKSNSDRAKKKKAEEKFSSGAATPSDITKIYEEMRAELAEGGQHAR